MLLNEKVAADLVSSEVVTGLLNEKPEDDGEVNKLGAVETAVEVLTVLLVDVKVEVFLAGRLAKALPKLKALG